MQLQIIHSRIYDIRGQKAMLDLDLAMLYEIETKYLKRAVRQNAKRFPADFMFELTKDEFEHLRCRLSTSNQRGGNRYLPFAFTEQGIAMLSSVLHTDKAIHMNIAIMRAFVEARKLVMDYTGLSAEVKDLKTLVSLHNEQLTQIFAAMENLSAEKENEKSWENRTMIGFSVRKNVVI
ncbi:MAG: ORF6N domain-containing protein [Chitinophagaceae bacterium]|nr:ORF6N domain-containing protein [Chitinophagaceae bacterium]